MTKKWAENPGAATRDGFEQVFKGVLLSSRLKT